jgi:hypothetical protein
MAAHRDADAPPAGEFLCPGCGRPLAVVLRSSMSFAEAQVYCEACERDYRERRGTWADAGDGAPTLRELLDGGRPTR